MRLSILVLFCFLSVSVCAQDPLRFKEEVATLTKSDSGLNPKKLVVFTGSSSIKGWRNLADCFPGHNVINRGFGGSNMNDLLHYTTPLIISYNPARIFIYEGDNDIAAGKSPHEILETADNVLRLIREKLPNNVNVIFISAKPSISRWHLKKQYEEFNQKLKNWAATKEGVHYADVWTPMLDANGNVLTDIFLDDNLHMNEKGYDIWTSVLKKFL